MPDQLQRFRSPSPEFHWERKGRFRERAVLANVPSFRFLFRGNIRMYPRSGFRSRGTSAKTTLLETTLLPTPETSFEKKIFLPGARPKFKLKNFKKKARKSGTKKEPKPKLLSPIFSGGVGVFHVKGWGPKSSVCPSKPRESNFFGGISRDFAGISRKRPKSLRKKCLGSILVP